MRPGGAACGGGAEGGVGSAQRWGGVRPVGHIIKGLWHNRDLFTCAVWPNLGHSAPPRALDLATQHS